MRQAPRSGPLLDGDPGRIGEYEILGRLGAGGMGVVFLGRSGAGRLVAVKVIHTGLARDDEFRARFRSEVVRARQVPPFCTAEVLDADPDAAQPYLVTEYVDGPTLSAEIRDNGPLSSANLHAVAVGIATALSVIHDAGVIHRDLKPGNVMLAPGSPKVIDFGIARASQGPVDRHTRTGLVMGSVNYMSPERFDEPAPALTPAADIFAWGCVIAFAGTGHAPFEAESTIATLARIITKPPRLDGLPDGPLRRLVTQALAVDPAQRPSARDLLTALLGGGAGTATPESGTPAPAGSGALAPPVSAAPAGTNAPAGPGNAAPVPPGSAASVPTENATATPPGNATPALPASGTDTPSGGGTPVPSGGSTSVPAGNGAAAPPGHGTPVQAGSPTPHGNGAQVQAGNPTPTPHGNGIPVSSGNGAATPHGNAVLASAGSSTPAPPGNASAAGNGSGTPARGGIPTPPPGNAAAAVGPGNAVPGVPGNAVPVPAASGGGKRGRLVPVLLLTVVVLVLALAGGTGFVVYRSNSVAAVPAGGGPTAYGIGPSPLLTSSGSPSAVPSKRVTSAAARTSKPATAAATRAPSKKPVATTAAATTVGDQPPVKAGGLDGTVSAFGPYFVLNNATGMCVDLEGTGPGAVGQQVVQFTCQKTTADNQEFAFVPNGADSAGDQLYLVRNTSDNLCLDVDGAGPVPKGTSVLEGTCLVHDNQDFRLQPEFTNGGRQFYRLINVASDMCLDVLGDRDPTPMLKLTLAPCASGGDHEWGLVKRSDW